MLARIKRDLAKHWVSWTGFIGLVVIGSLTLTFRPEQAVMAIMCWVLVCLGMYIEATNDKKGDKV